MRGRKQVRVPACLYAGFDDKLQAAAEAFLDSHPEFVCGLDAIGADWAPDERDTIVLDVPAYVRCAILRECGNGLATVGDYVAGNDGECYRVITCGEIQTGCFPGDGDWCWATVMLADWDDTDAPEPVCACELEGD